MLDRVGLRITTFVGTMVCAILFGCLALFALPQAVSDATSNGFRPLPLVTWTAQTFLQLVLLSIILVGQRLQSERTEARDIETHDAVMATLGALHDKSDLMHVKIDELAK
jgi:hypothetical protein